MIVVIKIRETGLDLLLKRTGDDNAMKGVLMDDLKKKIWCSTTRKVAR